MLSSYNINPARPRLVSVGAQIHSFRQFPSIPRAALVSRRRGFARHGLRKAAPTTRRQGPPGRQRLASAAVCRRVSDDQGAAQLVVQDRPSDRERRRIAFSSTTPSSPAIGGANLGSRRPSSSSTPAIARRATGDSQSDGQIERWHKTLKGECIRVKTPLSLEDAQRLVTEFVVQYTLSLPFGIGTKAANRSHLI